MRRENVALWITVDPTHLTRRLDIDVNLLAVLTAVSYRIGAFLLWVVAWDLGFSVKWSRTQL